MSNVSEHNQCLPKKEIIRRRDAFRYIIHNGTCWRFRYLQFYFIRASERGVGFAVPRRLGKAIQRNRIKRLMREVYRKNRQWIGSYHIVIIAREEAHGADYRDIEEEFSLFMHKAGFLN